MKPKISKKKVKKTSKKKTREKIVRKYRISDMDRVYKLLNAVQVNKKEVEFAVNDNMEIIVENTLKDIDLKYEKNNIKTKNKIVFTVFPNEEDNDLNEMSLDDDFFTEHFAL